MNPNAVPMLQSQSNQMQGLIEQQEYSLLEFEFDREADDLEQVTLLHEAEGIPIGRQECSIETGSINKQPEALCQEVISSGDAFASPEIEADNRPQSPDDEINLEELAATIETCQSLKTQPLFINYSREFLKIDVDQQSISNYDNQLEELKATDGYTKDAQYYVYTRTAGYFCRICKNLSIERREKRGKPRNRSGEVEVSQFEEQTIQVFCQQTKSQGNFEMLRKFFGYPVKMEEKVLIKEHTGCDRIRQLSLDYFRSNELVRDLMSGVFKFNRKMFLMKVLDLFEKFPINPERCASFSR